MIYKCINLRILYSTLVFFVFVAGSVLKRVAVRHTIYCLNEIGQNYMYSCTVIIVERIFGMLFCKMKDDTYIDIHRTHIQNISYSYTYK